MEVDQILKGGQMKAKKQSQCDRILKKLKRKKGVSVPELLKMGIACHTARMTELRDMGYDVINIKRWCKKNREWHSYYVLGGWV